MTNNNTAIGTISGLCGGMVKFILNIHFSAGFWQNTLESMIAAAGCAAVGTAMAVIVKRLFKIKK